MIGVLDNIVRELIDAVNSSNESVFNSILTTIKNKYHCDITYISEGSSRHVWRIDGRYVLKVAFGDLGILQNQIELNTWLSLRWDDRKYFARIYLWSPQHTWLLCEYVGQLNASPTDASLYYVDDQTANSITELAAKYNIHIGDLIYQDDDGRKAIADDNVVLLGDSFKILDYGCDPDLYNEFYA